MKNSNIAIIGCGYWGTIIAKNISNFEKRNIFVYDKNKKNSNNLKKIIKNIIVVNNIEFIYKNNDIKNIFLITPPSINFSILKKLILKKKNIFVEKPFLIKKNQIKEIKNLIRLNKNIFMVGYLYVYNVYINKIKNIINKNDLGKILYINLQRENLGPVRNDIDCSYDLATHDLSILKFLFNDKLRVIKIIKHCLLKDKIADISTIQLKCKNIKINIHSSWLSPYKIRNLIIVGEKKMLVFDEMQEKHKIKIFNQYAEYPKILSFGKKIFSKKARVYKGKYKLLSVKSENTLLKELKYFVNCTKKKQQPLTDIKFAEDIINILS